MPGTHPHKRKTAVYTEEQLQSALEAVQGKNNLMVKTD